MIGGTAYTWKRGERDDERREHSGKYMLFLSLFVFFCLILIKKQALKNVYVCLCMCMCGCKGCWGLKAWVSASKLNGKQASSLCWQVRKTLPRGQHNYVSLSSRCLCPCGYAYMAMSFSVSLHWCECRCESFWIQSKTFPLSLHWHWLSLLWNSALLSWQKAI